MVKRAAVNRLMGVRFSQGPRTKTNAEDDRDSSESAWALHYKTCPLWPYRIVVIASGCLPEDQGPIPCKVARALMTKCSLAVNKH